MNYTAAACERHDLEPFLLHSDRFIHSLANSLGIEVTNDDLLSIGTYRCTKCGQLFDGSTVPEGWVPDAD